MASALRCQGWSWGSLPRLAPPPAVAATTASASASAAARHYCYLLQGGAVAAHKAGSTAGQTTNTKQHRSFSCSFRTQTPRGINKASSVASLSKAHRDLLASYPTSSCQPNHHHQHHHHSHPSRQVVVPSSPSSSPSSVNRPLQPRPRSRNTSTMATKTTDHTYPTLIDLLANRRSYYSLNSSSPIPDSKIREILKACLDTVPSSFNMQSTRIVLAVGEYHHKIWDHTVDVLRAKMGEERWKDAPTAGKLASFRAGHGTVLFYDDVRDVKVMQDKFAAYADKFHPWADHSNGMHQLAVWTALEAEGLGANLQHYNPVIDAGLAKEFDIPDGWELKAQMVFGGIEGDRPPAKDKKPMDTVLKVFGA